MVCLPIISTFFLIIFWIIYKFFHRLSYKEILEKILITSAITFFYFQPNIINALAKVFDCSSIENEEFLTEYLNINCRTNEAYQIWKYSLFLPAFCFFTIILPLVPFCYMYRNRNQLYEEKIIYKVAFLLNGFSKDKFYWYFEKISIINHIYK